MREAIRERQNCKRSLERLAAQCLLYRRVKTVENWRLVFVFLVAVMLLTGLAVEAEPFSQGATVAVVLFWFTLRCYPVRGLCADWRHGRLISFDSEGSGPSAR